MDERQPRVERRRLTHVDRRGRPRMVDVSEKPVTPRRAVAEAEVACSQDTLSQVIDGGGPKGDVLTVAELAGVMAGKKTSELIPLCHPLPLTHLVVTVTPDRTASALRVRAEAATTAQTGVEMEALTAAAVAALTVYDMVKGVEKGVEIRHLRLVSKTGGKSGEWQRSAAPAGGAGEATADETTPRGPVEVIVPAVPPGARGPLRGGARPGGTRPGGPRPGGIRRSPARRPGGA